MWACPACFLAVSEKDIQDMGRIKPAVNGKMETDLCQSGKGVRCGRQAYDRYYFRKGCTEVFHEMVIHRQPGA